jgi:hypothetical protein
MPVSGHAQTGFSESHIKFTWEKILKSDLPLKYHGEGSA